LKELDALRDEIAQLTNYDDALLLQKYNIMLIDYFVGINFLGNKFSFAEDGVNIVFPWKDSLTGEKKASNKDLNLELNSVLYNLGAVINNMGTHTPIEGDNIKIIS